MVFSSMRVAIKDIAERAQVSKTVVSLYLNRRPLAEKFAAEHHQCDNAEFLAAAGAALRIDNAEFTPERARELFAGFLADSAAWRERGRRAAALARPRAAEELLEEISAGAVSGDCIPGLKFS